MAILATHGRDNFGCFTRKRPTTKTGTESTTYEFHIPFLPGSQSPQTSFTRPSSGLSSFETLDNGTITPFEFTPETSPTKPPDTTLPEPESSPPQHIMATEQVKPFHGDKEDENPEDFLRSFFRRMGTANDDVKKRQFKNDLQADSAADEWFEGLQPVERKDWDSIEDAFNRRWPRKKAAKKTTEEYEDEIIGLRLNTEDLGKKEKTAGREVYSHIAWADKMTTTVKGANIEATTTYIGHVRKELPKLLREKLGAGVDTRTESHSYRQCA